MSLDSPPQKRRRYAETTTSFDPNIFTTFTGKELSPDILKRLEDVSDGDMERAINMYFDGSWKSTAVPRPLLTLRNGPLAESMPEKRYIGAFGVASWATRSGTGIISHGESVRIERQRKASQITTVKKARKIKERKDIVVRFTNSKGEEVGRLPQDTAAFVSTLIDQQICSFEGLCVYAPERIRTNDTINIQLRCFMLRRGFEQRSNEPIDATDDEKALRLRQVTVALVKLFQEIDLQPSVTNITTTKYKRTSILQAAEIAEQYEVAESEGASSEVKDVLEGEKEEGKELEQDQLDQLYRKAQLFDFDYPTAEPADTFAMDLRRYQKQALHWFLKKEKNISERDNESESMHPLWEEYTWPIKDENDMSLPNVGKDKFYINPYSGGLSLEFPDPRQEQNCLGGILADEMGLGKTIEMLSLIHSHKSDRACTTLVVAPMSLLSQWQSEAEAASKPGTLKTLIYYEKKIPLKNICSSATPTLIITSYGTVLSEYAQGGNQGLFSVKFFRIILDEGHHIKNRLSKTARACYELNAKHRWVLTGTPIVNRLEDLFSLVRFLRVEPWSNFSYWKTFITVPFESKDFLRALDVVQTVLEPLVLRRTKEMRTPDGMPLVPLPPKQIIIEKIILSKDEREVYSHLQNRAKRSFARNLEAGTLMKSYTSILAQILRLRQSCCHPTLVRTPEITEDDSEAIDDIDLNELIDRFSDQNEENSNAYGAEILKQIRDEAEHECPICFSAPMDDMAVTGCYHAACKECWMNVIERGREKEEVPKCVICREAINVRDLFEVIRVRDTKEDMPLEITLRRVSSKSSAKIEALIKQLKQLRKEEPNTKSAVFSQFTSFLDLIEPALRREKIPFFRFDGSMQQQQRATVINVFKAYEGAVVLLISLRSGGVGLNLTEARRVFMMDPWWSFAVEAQAIDRVHRMGQTQEVIVHRYIVEGSVEERMINKIQARKQFIASSLGMMNDDERRQARIDDIKDLLND